MTFEVAHLIPRKHYISLPYRSGAGYVHSAHMSLTTR